MLLLIKDFWSIDNTFCCHSYWSSYIDWFNTIREKKHSNIYNKKINLSLFLIFPRSSIWILNQMRHIYFLCWNPVIDCQHWISSIFINLEGLLVILVKQNRPDLVYLKSFTFNISHSQVELNTVFSSLSMNSTWIQCFKFIIKISLWVFCLMCEVLN